MSSFFGMFRPQGGPVDLGAFEDMRKAMKQEVFDEMKIHVEEKIAVGHLRLRVSPEDDYDQQPLKSSCGRYLLVGHFRLDYRDELGDKIGLTQYELEKTSDSMLVMMSIQKWGEECVQHIEGDWAFVLYDSFLNSIIIAKDQTGYSACYYFKYKESVFFSSDINIIQSISTIPFEIDMFQFFRMGFVGVMLENGCTLYKDLFHLKSGQFIHFDKDLFSRSHIYWLTSGVYKNLFRYDEDYAYSMFSLLSSAVKSRLRSSKEIGIFLSAGLDSTSVASFASSELRSKNKSLFSFTSYPAHLDLLTESEVAFADETELLKAFVSRYSNIVPSYLNFKDVSVSDLFKSPHTKDAFYPVVNMNSFWIKGIFEKAEQNDIKLFFNGQMGNFTISHPAFFIYSELLIKFKFFELFSYIIRHKRIKGASIFSILKSRLFRPLTIQVKSYFKSKTLFSKRFFKSSKYVKPLSFLVKKLVEQSKNDQYTVGYYFITSSKALRLAQINRNMTFAGMHWYKLANESGVLVTDPTSDKRVLEFSLLIPEIQFNKNGIFKYLYKNMMGSQLPKEIIYNSKSMAQSYDFGLRLKFDSSFQDLIQEISKNTDFSNIFNVEEFSKQYHKIINSKFPHRNRLLIGELLLNLSLFIFFCNKKTNFTPDHYE